MILFFLHFDFIFYCVIVTLWGECDFSHTVITFCFDKKLIKPHTIHTNLICIVLHANSTQTSLKLHANFTQTLHKLHANFTQTSRKLHANFTQTSHKLHVYFTQTSRKHNANFTQTSRKLHANFNLVFDSDSVHNVHVNGWMQQSICWIESRNFIQ